MGQPRRCWAPPPGALAKAAAAKLERCHGQLLPRFVAVRASLPTPLPSPAQP
jgi:hypothetical protein